MADGNDQPNLTDVRNVVIIGSGPAGLTAALYAARATLNPLVISGFDRGGPKGGQLMLTTEVENYPGYPEGVTGSTLIDDLLQQAKRFGTDYLDFTDITDVDLDQRPFVLRGTSSLSGDAIEITTKALIIATGASANYLGLESEKEFMNRGVSACATCDGALPIFRDAPVAVVGGGDSACEEAIYLTRFASRVYMIHRRDKLRASKIMQDRALANDKIEPVWHHVVERVEGEKYVTGLRLKNVKDDSERTLEVSGMFVAIGHTPNADVFKGKLEMDEKGYVVTKGRSTYTSVDGVFAAGDVQDSVYRQAITAAGSGCAAAIDAERWLEANEG